MQKADLLDELRLEIGMMSDRCSRDLSTLYQFVCSILYKSIQEYQSVSIYLVENGMFRRRFHDGDEGMPTLIPFGDDFLTVAGMRGGMVWEKRNAYHYLAFPFYCHHHLVGFMVVKRKEESKFEEEEILFFGEVISLFESKENQSALNKGDEEKRTG